MGKESVKTKCIARIKCQPRCDDGKIRFFQPGDVFYFSNIPTHFLPVSEAGSGKIDFKRVAENLLRDPNAISLRDIQTHMAEEYGEDYKDFTRKETVDALMSLRSTDTSSLGTTAAQPKTASEYRNPKAMDDNLGVSVSFEEEEGVVLDDKPKSKPKAKAKAKPKAEVDEGDLDDLLDL